MINCEKKKAVFFCLVLFATMTQHRLTTSLIIFGNHYRFRFVCFVFWFGLVWLIGGIDGLAH